MTLDSYIQRLEAAVSELKEGIGMLCRLDTPQRKKYREKVSGRLVPWGRGACVRQGQGYGSV